MKTYLVWEDECADEGSFEIDAESEEDAIRKYREDAAPEWEFECSATLLTLEIAAARVGNLLLDALPSNPAKRRAEVTRRAEEAARILAIARAQDSAEKGGV